MQMLNLYVQLQQMHHSLYIIYCYLLFKFYHSTNMASATIRKFNWTGSQRFSPPALHTLY